MTLTEEIVLWCVGLTIFALLFVPVVAIFPFIFGIMTVIGAVRSVPANPPTVAVTTIWGRRQRRVVRERLVLANPFFPIMEDLIFIGTTRQVRTIKLPNIRCRAVLAKAGKAKKAKMIGSSVTAEMGVIIQPYFESAESMIAYLNAGGKGWPPLCHRDGDIAIDHEAEERNERDRVWVQLETLLAGAMRQEATTRTWQELALSLKELSAKLVTRLTGETPSMRVRTTPDGIPIPNLDPHAGYEYEIEPIPAGHTLTDYDYAYFLHTINSQGARDVHGLGIIIRAATLEDVEPEQSVKDDQARVDREAAQRVAEEIDFGTEDRLVRIYLKRAQKRGETLTYADALQMVRINRGRANESVVRGSGSSLVDAAALFRQQPPPKPPPGSSQD